MKKFGITSLLTDFIYTRFLFKQKKAVNSHTYGFLVHSRSVKDFHKKFPITRKLPDRVLQFLLRHLWPITVSHITGLKSNQDGRPIDGFVIGIPMVAKDMMEHRSHALKRIKQSVKLAHNRGARLVGLGGLTSSLSKGGLDLIEEFKDMSITTGHAYTAVNICNNVFAVTDLFGLDKRSLKVAIVGAAGSVGSTTAKFLAENGYKNFLLIDLARKNDAFNTLGAELQVINDSVLYEYSHQVRDIITADIIITATNAPEALVMSDDLKSGAIVIDDAQPSDVHPDALKREDVLVIEAGVVSTKGIHANFNFNLKHRDDNFCCMAELLILAAEGYTGNYVIHRATLENVHEMKQKGEAMGFTIGQFQNFLEVIKPEKLDRIRSILTR